MGNLKDERLGTASTAREARDDDDISMGSMEHESKDVIPSLPNTRNLARPVYRRGESDLEMSEVRTFQRPEMERNTSAFGGDIIVAKVMETVAKLEKEIGRGETKQILVGWEGDNDPENPQNWSTAYIWTITALVGIFTLSSSLASSAPSGVTPALIRELGMNKETATCVISMFVMGFCVGPVVWGSASETFGRRPVFIVSFILFTCFNVGCALSKNKQTLVVMRFLAGCFAASPFTNSGAIIADIFPASHRGLALSVFAVAPFAGPSVGPIVSGAVYVRGVHWTWLFWALTIFSGACLVVGFLFVPETYAPKLLSIKAARIRKETNDEHYVAPLDLTPLSLGEIIQSTLVFPFVMLAQEPILLLVTIYMSFLYGCLYLLFTAYPIVFQGLHGFNALEEGLCFLPLFIGCFLAAASNAFFFNPRYIAKQAECAKDGVRVPAEVRLEPCLVASLIFVVGFFWLGWTSYTGVSYWAPLCSGFLTGFAILSIFLSLFNYIVEVYLSRAASALAGSTIVRSLVGGAFPLFARQMYDALDPRWASTLLGFFALLMVPVPFLFYKYGASIRKSSKFAV